MQISTDIITGLSIGVEWISADAEAGIEHSCLLLDVLFMRVVVEFTGQQ